MQINRLSHINAIFDRGNLTKAASTTEQISNT